MNLLILGGTTFIGRHVAELAMKSGDTITFFNRGSTLKLFPEHETIVGDRTGDYAALEAMIQRGRRWDAIFDHFAYTPEHIKGLESIIRNATGLYALISTSSVYKDFGNGLVDESSPTLTISQDAYEAALRLQPRAEPGRGLGVAFGPVKARLEVDLRAAFGEDRSLIVRPGFLAGPYDYLNHYGGRLPYWLRRASRVGDMLVPGAPEDRIRPLDVRDLAQWALEAMHHGLSGTYNVTGQDGVTMGDLIDGCVEVTGGKAIPRWIAEDVTLQSDALAQVTDLPFWLPGTLNSYYDVQDVKARSHGLAYRPLLETIRDTYAWLSRIPVSSEEFMGMGLPRESLLLGAAAGN